MGKKARDLDQVKCIKDEEGNVLVKGQDINDRWKSYFHEIFNEGCEILLHPDKLLNREDGQKYTFYCRIWESGVKESLKMMDNGKANGPYYIYI